MRAQPRQPGRPRAASGSMGVPQGAEGGRRCLVCDTIRVPSAGRARHFAEEHAAQHPALSRQERRSRTRSRKDAIDGAFGCWSTVTAPARGRPRAPRDGRPVRGRSAVPCCVAGLRCPLRSRMRRDLLPQWVCREPSSSPVLTETTSPSPFSGGHAAAAGTAMSGDGPRQARHARNEVEHVSLPQPPDPGGRSAGGGARVLRRHAAFRSPGRQGTNDEPGGLPGWGVARPAPGTSRVAWAAWPRRAWGTRRGGRDEGDRGQWSGAARA